MNGIKKPYTKPDLNKVNFPPLPNNGIVGGSGAFGYIGGANIISAGKQILKSGIAKGALNFVKNIFKKPPKPRPGGKPVDFKGPNPMHKTGAGGNSYPR